MICDHVYEGLSYYVPDEAFALVAHLGKQPCPYCINKVFAEHGVHVRGHVQMDLSNFHAINREVITQLEFLDNRLTRRANGYSDT